MRGQAGATSAARALARAQRRRRARVSVCRRSGARGERIACTMLVAGCAARHGVPCAHVQQHEARQVPGFNQLARAVAEAGVRRCVWARAVESAACVPHVPRARGRVCGSLWCAMCSCAAWRGQAGDRVCAGGKRPGRSGASGRWAGRERWRAGEALRLQRERKGTSWVGSACCMLGGPGLGRWRMITCGRVYDVARVARFARNVGTPRRTVCATRAVRACGAGRAVVMCALADRGQHVPAAREGFF